MLVSRCLEGSPQRGGGFPVVTQRRSVGQCRHWVAPAMLAWLAFFAADSPADAQAPDADAAATRDYAVALGFQKRGLYPQAARRWETFLKTYPKDKRVAGAHYHLGVCRFQQKEFDQAAETFRTVLTKFPQFEHCDGAQFNLALVLYTAALDSKKPDDFKQAAEAFAQVPAKFPKSEQRAEAEYYQAECLYQSGDKGAAVRAYETVISKHSDSPLLPDVYYALGTTQHELEKYAEAGRAFQTFLEKFPKAARADECRLRLGLARLARKEYAEAEKLFAQAAAARDFPLAAFALLQQGHAVLAQEKPSDAAGLYESLPRKFPESEHIGAALLAAGKSRYQAQQYPQAQTALQAVVTQKLTEAPQAAWWLGRTLIALKKPAEAVRTLDAAIKAWPESEFLPRLEFTRIEALDEQDEGRKQAAELYAGFAKKYADDPLAADALYRASLSALGLGRYPEARTHAEAFLAGAKWKEHPLVPDVLFIAGESCLLPSEPDLATAESRYRRLLAEYPMHGQAPRAALRIGFCLHSAEKHDEAVAFLTKAAERFKDPDLRAEAHLLIGRSHAGAGRHKEATLAFRAALTASPKWSRGDEAFYALALSLRALKEADAAASELSKLDAQYPNSPYRARALYQLGEIAYEQTKYDDAANRYRQIVADFPQDELVPAARYGIATALVAKTDYKSAVNELTQLLEAHPRSDVAAGGLYLRGVCHQRLEQFDRGIEDLTQFLGGKPAEDDALHARYALALCQAGAKQHEQAVATLNGLLKAKPDYADADKVYYELGFACLATDKTNEAAAAFEHLATKLPDSPLAAEAWFRVGELHERGDRPGQAAKAFAAGLDKARQPDLRERLAYKLGWNQYRQEQFAEAATTFQAMLKEHPDGRLRADANYLAGECLYKQSKFSAALPLFVAAIGAKDDRHAPRALYRAGDCAAHEKKWADSQRHYETLVSRHPKFPNINEARYGLALALQNQDRLDEAVKVYEQITRATNTETAAKSRFMIGEIAFAQKDYEKAVEHFLEAALGYPYKEWQAMGHFEAGRCFLELKDAEKARDSLETVVKQFPDHPRAKDARALLTKLNDK